MEYTDIQEAFDEAMSPIEQMVRILADGGNIQDDSHHRTYLQEVGVVFESLVENARSKFETAIKAEKEA
jgi:hypothetical protein